MARLPGTDGSGDIAERIRARRGGALRPLDRMLLHSPPLADGWNSLLGAVRQRMTLPAGLRELVILRIAVLNRAGYEWTAHEPEARAAGLGDRQLAAVRAADAAHHPDLDARQRRVVAYTDAMTRQVHVPDAVFDALRADFAEAELVELTATAAAYNMVSRFLVALDVADPSGKAPHDQEEKENMSEQRDGAGGRLGGKVALVTGAGAGIGQGCALLFAEQGATVVGCDIDPAAAERTRKLAAERGLALDVLAPYDMTDPDDARRFADEAYQRYGRVDALVTAGAIAPHMATAADMDFEDQWTPTMRGEVDVVFLPVQAAWRYMEASGGGSIINFASVNAFRGSGTFGMVAHCAGKAAVLGLTRQLAAEGGPMGIRANTISPGMVRTPATESAGAHEGAAQQALLSRIPLGRVGTPEDIAWCAVYLASDESAWVTGGNFPVDGGVLAK
ncbi:SDR family oxidoreductase [Streptomyces sp. NPDC059786]|uniref:SDR family oxidoreductase n=1 Tax=Streptomyces sp. NPDC059786 TaxID=3346946 RepID=UPI003647F4AB